MKRLFLDLEDTIITPVMSGWENTEVINIVEVKRIIDIFRPDVVDIFSFAIHNEKEKELFNKYCRPMVEEAIGVKLNIVPTVDKDIIKACAEQKRMAPSKIDFSDLSDFWSKDLAFELWCRQKFKNIDYPTQCVFLDDAVRNTYFKSLDGAHEAYVINVDELVANFNYISSLIKFETPLNTKPKFDFF